MLPVYSHDGISDDAPASQNVQFAETEQLSLIVTAQCEILKPNEGITDIQVSSKPFLIVCKDENSKLLYDTKTFDIGPRTCPAGVKYYKVVKIITELPSVIVICDGDFYYKLDPKLGELGLKFSPSQYES